MYYFVYIDDLTKPHSSICVVRMWCSIHTNPVLWHFDNPEGCGDLLDSIVPEPSSWLMV
jgi:hypothetical protein